MELLRRGYEAFNRGDFEGRLAFLDRDVELDERYIAPDAALYAKCTRLGQTPTACAADEMHKRLASVKRFSNANLALQYASKSSTDGACRRHPALASFQSIYSQIMCAAGRA